MEGKEPEKAEIERLAEMRAKRRLDSWSEQLKSNWFGGSILLGAFGFLGLMWTWLSWATGELNIGVPVAVTFIVGLLALLLNRSYKVWRKKRFRELYEEELLELKMKK